MQNSVPKPDYFPVLTGVRVIAAYLVFFHHFNPFSFLGKNSILYAFCTEMHVGVTLFFFLSGFLIAKRYYNKEIKWKIYFLNRFARIYPLYFILTSLTFFIWYLQNKGFDSKQYFLNITFLRGFLEDYKFSGIAQGWSLTVEETFYLLAPMLFALFRKNSIVFYIMPLFFGVFGFFIYKSNFDFMLDFTFLGRSIEFFSGIILAIYIEKVRLSKYAVFTYLGVFSIIFWIYVLTQMKGVHNFGTDSMEGKVVNTILLPILGFVPFFIGILKENTIFSKILSTKIFQLLGKSSYAFYLIHLGLIQVILAKIFPNQIIVFLALNIVSILLYLTVEKPLNDFIRKKYFVS